MDTKFSREIREAMKLPADAPAQVVLASIDVMNARSCARLGLPAGTPPTQIRAAEAAERTLAERERAVAARERAVAAATAQAPRETLRKVATEVGDPADWDMYPTSRVPQTTSMSIDWAAVLNEDGEA